MRKYYHVPFNADNVVIFPSKVVVIRNALRLFSSHLEAPRQSNLITKLIKNLKSQLVNWVLTYEEAVRKKGAPHDCLDDASACCNEACSHQVRARVGQCYSLCS